MYTKSFENYLLLVHYRYCISAWQVSLQNFLPGYGAVYGYNPTVVVAATSQGRAEFVCELCGKEVANRNSLIGHMRVHTGEKPYACTRCKYRAKDKSTLNRHVKFRHKDDDADQWIYLNLIFTFTFTLMLHFYTGCTLLLII